MCKFLLAAVAGLCLSAVALAQPPLRALDDAELAQVSAADGISFAMHLVVSDSSLSWGMRDAGGQSSYIVFKNLGGTVDMFATTLDVLKKPDGSSYVEVGLPVYLKYTNYGFESLSVQNDPLAPTTGNLGGINTNGTLSLQGQVRFWAH